MPGLTSAEPADHSGRPISVAEDLMSKVAAGDRAAFADLYDLFADRVFGLALMLVRDRDLAQDVAQDTFLNIWRCASRYDPGRGPVGPWLLLITRSIAVDRIRHWEALRRREHRFAVSQPAHDGDEVPDTVLRHLDHQRIRAMMTLLTPLQNEALRLVYYDNLTHQDISDLLKVPLGTVKSRIRDGVLAMRTHVAEPS